MSASNTSTAAARPAVRPVPAGAPPGSKADTFLVSCIDPRFTDDTTFRFAALGRTDRYSEMRIAGAALALVDAGRPAWQAALWENLEASRELHGIRNVTLLNHRDCGAMDLWAGRRLADDPAEEFRLHEEVLNAAADAIRARHPDLLIEIKLMELDGAVTRPACRSCVPAGFRLGPVGADGLTALEPLATGAVAPGAAAGAAGAARFAELVRLRGAAGPLDAEAELELLGIGVLEAGQTAEQARRTLAAAQGDQPQASTTERDTLAYLRSRADAQGRIGPDAVAEAAGLHRSAGASGGRAASRAAVMRLAEREGLRPRPQGIWPFRSTRWFDPTGGKGVA